ncbi:MAG TPA: DUF4395 domain-containing protein [Pseudobdellovibrionaceae bacterium]|nr:DUF4395 domain-containing protein [Pseudobdellovibrionaceae bacterium]
MKKYQFGEDVAGFSIPVLNEREVRAAAGLLFIFVFLAMQRVVFLWDFTFLKFVSTFFLADFILRVFVSPRFSPSLILGRLIVRNQTPEYVGAEQKKFAWTIGVILGAIMFISLNILNTHSPISGLICMICLLFLFLETAFGICLGCKMYPLVYRKKPQYCPGEICELKDKQPIQFTSKSQFIVLTIFILIFLATIPALKEHYSKEPTLSFGMEKPPMFQERTQEEP